MSNRELRAVAEAINDAADAFPWSYRYGNKLAQAAISASNSQYVKGLVGALKEIKKLGEKDVSMRGEHYQGIVINALQNLPEDLR